MVTCGCSDVPLKEYIRFLDESLPKAERFILQDLDDTHLFVKPASLDFVQAKVKEWVDKTHFEPPKEQQQQQQQQQQQH
jgi:TFIIH basal transcription factor complex TTD-A subunit